MREDQGGSRGRRRRPLVWLALAVATVVAIYAVGTLTPMASRGTAAAPEPRYQLGTLMSLSSKAAEEARRGISVAMVELSWRQHETAPGTFSASYESAVRAEVATMRSAGRKVTLGLGLHDAPAWVHELPDSHLVNQHGATSEDLDMIFNQSLRTHAEQYIRRVAKVVPLSGVWAVRITAGGNAEVLYPDASGYWAFGPNAQNGPDMPASMPRNPLPGWTPGSPGQSTAKMREWANWYVGALYNVVAWQINTLRRNGFRGWNQVLTTGKGVTPAEYNDAIARRLPDGLTAVGAVWHVFYAQLRDKTKVVAYVTSMADGSGNNDVCQPSDRRVSLTSSTTKTWSATRWVSRIADQYGLPKNGENPGFGHPTRLNAHYRDASDTGMMAAALRQMRACGFQGMYWAHDQQLWDGTSSFTRFTSLAAKAQSLADDQ